MQVYTVPFQWGLPIFIKKNLWRRVLEANKKQVPTRITDWKILCVYIHVYQIIKNWGPGPYNSVCHTDNRNYFLVYLWCKIERKCTCFTWQGKWKKSEDVLAEKKVTLSWLMNLNMVRSEKLDHLHLVYSTFKGYWDIIFPLNSTQMFQTWGFLFQIMLHIGIYQDQLNTKCYFFLRKYCVWR